jgi:hypothetical protein
MHTTIRLAAAAALAACLALPVRGVTAADAKADQAFAAFWSARSPKDAAKAIPGILASGVTFDDAWQRLRQGRPYAADVATGIVRSSYGAHGREFFYAVDVPRSYSPTRRYPVRIQLHGGVGRPSNQPRGNGSIGALAAGADQIYLLPTGWEDAPWWSELQLENLRVLLDRVKRTYNVDENRVVLSGVSDGGTGTYYVAMHDITPYASFEPLIGFIMVLDSVDGAGEQFPNNLVNKPFFVVNDGMDPLYPTRIVSPYVKLLQQGGVELVYHQHPDAGHNTRWWPEEKDAFDAFVNSHPRIPFPDRLTWESAAPEDNRADWLVIDTLARGGAQPPLDDLNRTPGGTELFEHHRPSGRVDLLRTGNTITLTTRGVATLTLLLSPDVFDFESPVRVVANGRTVFDGRVEKSLDTLLEWAARDNDRTMLFGAELHVTIPR